MVHFVGAGPGAPDLITLRGAALLADADVVVYAGSLVNPALLERCKPDCVLHNSAEMTLPEVIAVLESAEAAGLESVRLHTGDPSLYGAIREQMDALAARGIAYDVTPGVSSLFGAAAALGAEFTLPGVSQSLIVTRMAGRTDVPERETLRSFARHGASMALFLSAGMLERVRDELLAGGFALQTPAAIVYKATWPDETVLRCTVGSLAETGALAGIRKTALVLVGDFLDAPYEKSKLYDPAFTTEFRQGSGEIPPEPAENTSECAKDGIAYLSFTERGRMLAERLCNALGGEVACTRDGVGLRDWTARQFPRARALVYVGAAGIAVRAIAPHLIGKASDPAVVAVDERGQYAIPLASGHLGGANELARRIAHVIGASAAITTATDVNDVFAVDEWARVQNCAVAGIPHIRTASAKLLDGSEISVRSSCAIDGNPPQGVCLTQTGEKPDVWVDFHPHAGLVVVPRMLVLGIGCRRGVTSATLEARFAEFCRSADVLPEAICSAATIDLKKNENGLLEFCAAHGWRLITGSAEELSAVAGTFTASDFVAKTTGVDNVCERAALYAAGENAVLLHGKFAGEGITFALAKRPVLLDWKWKNG